MEAIDRIKELVEQLNYHRNLYYNDSRPEISDFEYDTFFDELAKLEEETGFVLATSPTQTVGYEVKSNLTKVKHNHPMLSLDKTKEVEQLQIAKLLDYDDFRYTTVATRRPLRYWFENITEKYHALCENEAFDANSKKNAILKTVSEVEGIDDKRSDSDFFAFLKSNKVKYTATELKLLRSMFGVIDEEAPEVYEKPFDKNSDCVADTNLNDNEKIPQKQNIDEYFEHEVLPYTPDAWMDRSKDKLGVEFPFTRIFYKYRPLRTVEAIMAELNDLDDSINL